MNFGFNLTIRKKLTYSFLGLTAFLALVAALAAGIMVWRAQNRALATKATSLAQMVGEAVASNIVSDERYLSGSTVRALNFLKGDGDVSLAAVVTIKDGKPAVPFFKKFTEDAKLDAMSMAGPLAAGRTEYGKAGYRVLAHAVPVTGAEPGKQYHLMLVMNTSSGNRQLAITILVMVVLGLAMVAVGAASAVALGKAIVKPLETINERMHNISEGEGDLTARLDESGSDEIAQLSASFNRFVANIQGIVQQVVSISGGIASGSLQMHASMNEMEHTAEAIAQSADSQRGNVQQATAKVGAIAQSSQVIHTKVNNALTVFGQAREAADRGGEAVQEVVAGMAAIDTNSRQIGSILTVITEIANQTNLLSLNAAIEAAKAGENGKGFAVVAEEVRKLAERSSQAAKEISGLIRTSTKSIEAGSATVAAAGTGLASIQEAIGASGEHIQAIGGESQAQSQDSGTVVGFMGSLSDIAEQNAAATEEMAATLREAARTVEDLSKAAEGLNALVSRFKV
jgi:methyl-accepting chemotaxis protein